MFNESRLHMFSIMPLCDELSVHLDLSTFLSIAFVTLHVMLVDVIVKVD